jgi:hypothetical protein
MRLRRVEMKFLSARGMLCARKWETQLRQAGSLFTAATVTVSKKLSKNEAKSV